MQQWIITPTAIAAYTTAIITVGGVAVALIRYFVRSEVRMGTTESVSKSLSEFRRELLVDLDRMFMRRGDCPLLCGKRDEGDGPLIVVDNS